MKKHTKGPWHTNNCLIYAAFRDKVVLIAEEEDEANADLMSAAPEMLEALEWALYHIQETHGLKNDEVSPITEAIKKAKGEV